jgi:hypothetical protein
MKPLEAAQAIIEARARATQGEWNARYIASACGMHESNAEFTALSANHAAAVAQAYKDAMQDNARLRFLLDDARDGLYALDLVSPERIAAIDAALEESR